MSAWLRTLAMGQLFLVAAALPVRAAEDSGVARYVPWSGSYWPVREGLLIAGPLAKYDRATGHSAAAWEYEQKPPGRNVPQWFGYCHAWAAASVMDREPIWELGAMSRDGRPMYLGIGDQKGMLTACHTADIAQHYGIRYTGSPEDDRNDIYPIELWRVLRLYIKQQGMPLIIDIEEGPEVWNYPVYAYRVVYRPMAAEGQYFAEMSVWMADDAVHPDCLGAKIAKQTYYFTFRLQQGSALAGSGRWVGPSVTNHPDFAWYPQVAQAENPEVRYKTVKSLVDASGTGPSTRRPATGERPTRPAPRPDETSRVQPPPNTVPGVSGGTHVASGDLPALPGAASPEARGQPYVLSPVELLSLVTNQTSAFTLDVTVDKFDGGRYVLEEKFSVSGAAAKSGHLYLLYLDTEGQLSVLYPYEGADNRVREQRRFELPGRGKEFRTFGPPGTHRIKAIVTREPLIFSGQLPELDDSQSERGFHLPPSQRSQFRDVLNRYLRREAFRDEDFGGVQPRQFLGEFAQDEVAFYVGPSSAPRASRED